MIQQMIEIVFMKLNASKLLNSTNALKTLKESNLQEEIKMWFDTIVTFPVNIKHDYVDMLEYFIISKCNSLKQCDDNFFMVKVQFN